MIREHIANAIDAVGASNAVLRFRRSTLNPWLTILTYHRVGDDRDALDLDAHVVDATPEVFERQLEYVGQWFDFITLDELFAYREGRPLPRNPLLLTFDDGYRDNYDVVFPILQKHRIRATFFVATHYVDHRQLFWWDRINWLVKRSKREAITLTYPVQESFSLATPHEREEAIRSALRRVKETFALDLDRFLGELARACDVHLSAEDERAMVDRILMTWDQLRTMRSAGMDVQSHTCTHRVVQTLPTDVLARELADSRARLEGVLGEPVRAVSYPVGHSRHYDARIRTEVRRAGYELGFSSSTGVNELFRFDPLNTKRLAVDWEMSEHQFRAMLALPILAQ